MNYYVEIHVAPDPEFPPAFLLNALFSKLHRALAAGQHQDIGVSFPAFKEGRRTQTLGNILRLHGARAALDTLMDSGWLRSMRDHVTVLPCQPIPSATRHRVVKRQQFKTSAERLRRRRAARHGETMAQARQHIPDSIEREVTLPYLHISSLSTRQRFCLFVAHGPLLAEPISGTFNTYGLSCTATIPWF